jgi:hypothetical protein
MLRILLIILVALAVIIGLMRLTGAKPGDPVPEAATAEPTGVEDAVEPPPAEDLIVDEPAVDALDAPADLPGDTALEPIEPGLEEAVVEESPAPEADEAAPADPVVEPAPENAAPTPDPNAPGR